MAVRIVWDDPSIRALGAVLVLVAAVPLAFMMGRSMLRFRRRKQETMSDVDHGHVEAVSGPLTDLQPVPLPEPGDDPQAAVREQAMAAADYTTTTNSWGSRDHSAALDAEMERRWIAEGVPPIPPARGTAPVPEPLIRQSRLTCEHCEGRGFMPGINDLLQESAALLGDEGGEVIRLFYSTLLRAHPQLLTLFPGDPTQGDFGSDHKGAKQRDKLLKALTALAGLYDPADPAKMDHLDEALASFGRSHAAFARQDGTIRGATLEEYAAVKEALFATLVTAAAGKWKPEYTEAWSQAYDYATAVMLAEQFRSGFAAPRFPRAGR